MDGQEYLNQISASNRPVKNSKFSGILSSKFFLVGVIGAAVLVLVIILGAMLSGNKGGEKNNSFRLLLHLSNTAEIAKTYQGDIKSSDLRASASSLSSVLANDSKSLEEYLVAKYNYNEKSVDSLILDEATVAKEELTDELQVAKINGVLDRTFAHKMAYEISVFLVEENKVLKSTNDSTLEEILGQSYSSLEKLYDKFNDFSEAK